MAYSLSFLPSREEVRARYRVGLLCAVRLGEGGLHHLSDGKEEMLAWEEVQQVLAAEVGEPEGVCTVVFDLVIEDGPEGFAVRRFDADPGDEAVAAARVLQERIPAERLPASVKSLAGEGVVVDWYADLESFEEAALTALVS